MAICIPNLKAYSKMVARQGLYTRSGNRGTSRMFLSARRWSCFRDPRGALWEPAFPSLFTKWIKSTAHRRRWFSLLSIFLYVLLPHSKSFGKELFCKTKTAEAYSAVVLLWKSDKGENVRHNVCHSPRAKAREDDENGQIKPFELCAVGVARFFFIPFGNIEFCALPIDRFALLAVFCAHLDFGQGATDYRNGIS